LADFVEGFVVGLVEDFAVDFIEVGEGVAPGCGGAEEDLECRALNLRTRGRSVLPAGVLKHLLTLGVGT